MTGYGKTLLMISVLDMIVTILGIHYGLIEEANFFMRWHLEQGGILLFASVKLLITAISILCFETVFEKELMSRIKMKRYYIAAILLYVLLYIVSILAVHREVIL